MHTDPGKDSRLSVAAGLYIGLVERTFGKVSEDEFGKLHATGIEFNLSHSGRYVAFACSDCPVGIDIERIGRNTNIARRVMVSEEYDDFLKADDRDDAFCRLWTAKESYIKALGQGLRLQPNTFRALYGAEIKCPSTDMWIMELDSPQGYRLSVCSADTECSCRSVTISDLLKASSLNDL